MRKRILVFDDDESYIQVLGIVIEDIVQRSNRDLVVEFDSCHTYCKGMAKVNELYESGGVGYYDLVLVDLKLPFAADRPEEGIENEFLGFRITRQIREMFGDRVQYLPITFLLSDIKRLDPSLRDIDAIDIEKTADKINLELLATRIIEMLTGG